MRIKTACLLAACCAAVTCTGALVGCGADEEAESGYSEVNSATDAGSLEDRDSEPPPAPWDATVYEAASTDTIDPGPPYPIVLHHGFSGWKQINLLGIHYFHEVAQTLAADGETMVFETVVDPYAGIEVRGDQLEPQIAHVLEVTGKAKVNIIAHSQGGLDSRYVISSLGYGARVASLTTISTPHHGTALGDRLADVIPDWTDPLINAIADAIGRTILDVQSDSDLRESLESLSEFNMLHSFNLENLDDPRVEYFSYAGRSNDAAGDPDCDGSWLGNDPSLKDHIDPLLTLTGSYLKDHGQYGGVNDGIVAVRSARWGLFMGCFPADHFDEIGQIAKSGPNAESGFDHRELYRQVVRRLRQRGF